MAEPGKKQKDYSQEAKTAISSAWDDARVSTTQFSIDGCSLQLFDRLQVTGKSALRGLLHWRSKLEMLVLVINRRSHKC
jgi:hypothetical protein